MNNIKELTDNQLIAYVFNGNNGIMKDSLQLALNGIFDIKADGRETLQLVRQALSENKTFCCAFDNAECVNDRPCNVPKAKLKLWVEDCELTNAYAGVHSKTIFDFCASFMLSNKCTSINHDGKVYYWITAKTIIEGLPIIGISTERGINNDLSTELFFPRLRDTI